MAGSLGDLVVSLGVDISGLSDASTAMESRLEQMGTRLFFLGSRIASSFGLPLAGAVAAIVEFGAQFDQAMTQAVAIMDDVTPEIQAKMAEQAKAISESTKFSATEAAKAYYDLASAGLNATDAINALPLVATFAQAGMMDISKAADWLAGSQVALGLKTNDASQNLVNMGRIADVLTEVNNKSIGTIKDFATALTTNGARAMEMYGISLEEGTAVLGVFGQQHILGSRAGQLLYQTLRDLTGAAVKHKEAFAQAGIAIFDDNGNMRSMADIADNLTAKFGPLTAEGRRTELQFLGITARSQQGINALIGMGDTLRGLTSDLQNAGGATQVVADKQMQSFINQMAILEHAFQNVAIQIFSEFVPAFKDYIVPWIQSAIGLAQEFATWLGTLTEAQKAYVMEAVALVVVLGPLLTMLGGLLLIGRVAVTMTAAISGLMALGEAATVASAAVAETTAATGAMAVVADGAVAVTGGLVGMWVLLAAGAVGVVYVLQEMVGGWGRLLDIINLFTGGILYSLVDGFKLIYNGVTGNLGVLSDLAQFMMGALYVAFLADKVILNELADAGAAMRSGLESIVSVMGSAITPIKSVGEAISGLNQFLRDHIPLLGTAEDWIVNHLVAGYNKTIQAYKDLIAWGKSWYQAMDQSIPTINQTSDAYLRMRNEMALFSLKKWTLANQPQQLSPSAGIGGQSVTSYLDSIYGTPEQQTAQADSLNKVAKAIQNIYDKVSGKTALADASAWYTAIQDLGGAYNLADADANSAVKVMETAIDRLDKMGLGASDTANAYRDLVEQLYNTTGAAQKLVEQVNKVNGGFDAMKLSANEFKSGFLEVPASEFKDILATMTAIEKIQQSGKVNNSGGPLGLPGFVPAEAIRGDAKNQGAPAKQTAKDFAAVTAQFQQMSSEFQRLGKDIGGTTGTILVGIAQFATEMVTASKAGTNMAKGMSEIGEGGKNAVAGVISLAQGMVQVAGSFLAATNNANEFQNVLGGMAVGAESGAQIGAATKIPGAAALGAAVGAAIGAVAALIKGRPEWASVADEVASTMGVQISQKLAQTIVDNSSQFGGSIQASMISSLSDIIKGAGGLTASNWTQFAGTLHDVFSMVGTDQMTLAQGTAVLDQNFTSFTKAGTDGLGFLDQKLVDIIKLNAQFGTQSVEIAGYLKQQASAIATGFNEIATGGMKPLNDLMASLTNAGTNLAGGMQTSTSKPGQIDTSDAKYVVGLLQQIQDAEATIQTIKDKGSKATAAQIQQEQDLTQKVKDLQTEYAALSDTQKQAGDQLQTQLKGGQDEFDRLGRLAELSFGAAIAGGSTFLEAITAIGPGLDQLSTAATNFGFTQTAAFGQLLEIRNFTQANQDLVGELDGVNKMIVGLANSGILTQASFTDLGAEARSVFDRMTSQGLDSNTALLMMQPTLQTLWEAQDKYGFKVDDSTQKLIDMGVQSGIVGEGNKTDSEKMVDGITDLNKTMKALVDTLTNGVGGAFDALKTKAGTVIDGITTGINGIPKNIDFNINAHASNDGAGAPAMANGGILTAPRTVYAGEAGPEAIIPLSQLSRMLGGSGGSGGNSGGDQTVQLVVDGRILTQIVLQNMPNELRRNGIFT